MRRERARRAARGSGEREWREGRRVGVARRAAGGKRGRRAGQREASEVGGLGWEVRPGGEVFEVGELELIEVGEPEREVGRAGTRSRWASREPIEVGGLGGDRGGRAGRRWRWAGRSGSRWASREGRWRRPRRVRTQAAYGNTPPHEGTEHGKSVPGQATEGRKANQRWGGTRKERHRAMPTPRGGGTREGRRRASGRRPQCRPRAGAEHDKNVPRHAAEGRKAESPQRWGGTREERHQASGRRPQSLKARNAGSGTNRTVGVRGLGPRRRRTAETPGRRARRTGGSDEAARRGGAHAAGRPLSPVPTGDSTMEGPGRGRHCCPPIVRLIHQRRSGWLPRVRQLLGRTSGGRPR